MLLKVFISFIFFSQFNFAQAEIRPLSSNKNYQTVIQKFIRSNQALVEARNYKLNVAIDIDSPHNLGGSSLEGNQFAPAKTDDHCCVFIRALS
jgi:hypothetical protein